MARSKCTSPDCNRTVAVSNVETTGGLCWHCYTEQEDAHPAKVRLRLIKFFAGVTLLVVGQMLVMKGGVPMEGEPLCYVCKKPHPNTSTTYEILVSGGGQTTLQHHDTCIPPREVSGGASTPRTRIKKRTGIISSFFYSLMLSAFVLLGIRVLLEYCELNLADLQAKFGTAMKTNVVLLLFVATNTIFLMLWTSLS